MCWRDTRCILFFQPDIHSLMCRPYLREPQRLTFCCNIYLRLPMFNSPDLIPAAL